MHRKFSTYHQLNRQCCVFIAVCKTCFSSGAYKPPSPIRQIKHNQNHRLSQWYAPRLQGEFTGRVSRRTERSINCNDCATARKRAIIHAFMFWTANVIRFALRLKAKAIHSHQLSWWIYYAKACMQKALAFASAYICYLLLCRIAPTGMARNTIQPGCQRPNTKPNTRKISVIITGFSHHSAAFFGFI